VPVFAEQTVDLYVFSRGKAIGIEDTRQSSMRLPPNRVSGKRVAASKPQALGMDADAKGWLNK
jgi:hypothetical protein